MGFPGGSEVKTSACNVGDLSLIPGLGRSLGGGNGNLLQYSCLENPMDGGAWWATVHEIAKSRTRLSDIWVYGYIHKYSYICISKETLSQNHLELSEKITFNRKGIGINVSD